MRIDDILDCARCGAIFGRRCPTGRRPLYCGRTCRQRAYEARRRVAYHHSLPARHGPPHRGRATYLHEAGRIMFVRHALRPDAAPDHDGRRPSLCGARTRARSAQRFGTTNPGIGRDCRTCTHLAETFPLTQPLDPPADLAMVKHQLLAARAGYLADDRGAIRVGLGRLLATLQPAPVPRSA